MTAPRLAVLALTLALGLASAGCSDDGGQGDGGQAASPTSSESSAADASTTSEEPALTKKNFAAKIMAAQAEAKTAHLEVTVEAQGQRLTMSGDVDGLDKPATASSDITASVGQQQFRLITVDQTFYIRGDGLPTRAGKPWLRIDVSDPSNPLKRAFDAANPGNFGAYLQGVIRFAHKGETEVDGTPAHRYSLTVDTAKMVAANPTFRGQNPQTLGLPASITSDVYVDDANRLLSMRVELGSLGAFQAHFSDYGEDVSISAPPPGQVADFGR